jgi:hypothetical protein
LPFSTPPPPQADVDRGATTGERSPRGESFAERVAAAGAAAPRDSEWEEDENGNEEDSFEKTFASGTILTHFCVIERRRGGGAGDLDFAAAAAAATVDNPGEAQVMLSAADGPGAGPEPIIAFALGRSVDVVVLVVVVGDVGGRPAASASVGGIAILSASVSRVK